MLRLYSTARASNLTASRVGGSRYTEIQGRHTRSTLQDRTLSPKFYKSDHILYVRFTSRFLHPPHLMQHTGPKVPPPPGELPPEIPKPANANGQPPKSWDSLRFSPIGVYHLRSWQGVFPGVKKFFIASQSRFRSADIAWFCSGSSRDNNHNHPQVSFHPSLVTLIGDTSSYAQGKTERKMLLAEVKELMFDSVRVSSEMFYHNATD